MESAALIHLKDRVKSVKRATTRLYRNPGVRAESLLEAALECLADEDYGRVTIPLIAKKMGDWSSDGCSSDLLGDRPPAGAELQGPPRRRVDGQG